MPSAVRGRAHVAWRAAQSRRVRSAHTRESEKESANMKSGRLIAAGTRNPVANQPTDPTRPGDAADLSIMGQLPKAVSSILYALK